MLALTDLHIDTISSSVWFIQSTNDDQESAEREIPIDLNLTIEWLGTVEPSRSPHQHNPNVILCIYCKPIYFIELIFPEGEINAEYQKPKAGDFVLFFE